MNADERFITLYAACLGGMLADPEDLGFVHGLDPEGKPIEGTCPESLAVRAYQAASSAYLLYMRCPPHHNLDESTLLNILRGNTKGTP